ncbi:type VII toxin-antitoxin system MntA family adenylyltransferase antitoxin [Caloramator australicus]|uniref:Predicted nucleotidyltransferase n=1 Tax=Caloramator australicus RC3 TaxID=857293 RepID=I7J565_9CLOT|nr:nucleotidyltransferase domain-containing protein [Caloramator australicus]CCJ33511.1 predicted nucleotidyltransferase [Caloramator australicus RC3]
MIQSNLQEVENILKENIDKLLSQFDIKLIYIFGSYAKGNNKKDSDLDIAVLMGAYSPFDKLNLIGEFMDIFKRDDIDLVILNDANEVLKFQVIKYGKNVYKISEDERVLFEARAMDEYMDMEFFRRRQKEIMDMVFKEKWGDISDKKYS